MSEFTSNIGACGIIIMKKYANEISSGAKKFSSSKKDKLLRYKSEWIAYNYGKISIKKLLFIENSDMKTTTIIKMLHISMAYFLSLHSRLIIIPMTLFAKHMVHEYSMNIIGEYINYGTSTKYPTSEPSKIAGTWYSML